MASYIREFIARNVRNPQGYFGSWFAKNAFIKSNTPLIENTIPLVGIQPDHVVLEVGFGPGVGLEIALKHVQQGLGKLYGIDISEPMIQAATSRLGSNITNQKVELIQGDVVNLPFEDNMFDRVYHTNCFYFWSDHEKAAKELYRVMKKDSMMVTTMEKERVEDAQRRGFMKYGNPDVDNYVSCVEKAGFSNVKVENKCMEKSDAPFIVIYATAKKE
ncbi:hypothetical protein FSP39_006047 [Pinctada imbricata]|uniref:Methyltransferase type 11 domain-containing protein n=1 Tax=Pinctada imbricata TaxID=66713 RepID=A0AA89BVG7_PINIB|nr:hypothetical protein FSP39_006047 [Pinctada imbricata]